MCQLIERLIPVEKLSFSTGISGLVVEYNVAIVVTRVRFPADALFCAMLRGGLLLKISMMRSIPWYSVVFPL